MKFTPAHLSFRIAGLLGFALICGMTTAAVGSSTVYGSGVSGYSGKSSGSTCNSCHSGGTTPTVTLTGPAYVLQNSQRSFALTISGGQQIAGGLDVATDVGVLVVTDSDTKLKSKEITHKNTKNVDSNGNVAWNFGMTAPLAPATVKLWGDGASVDGNGGTRGDDDATATLSITVVDNLARFVQYGTGLAGTGGVVPALSGVDGPSVGPWTLGVADGVGGGAGLLVMGHASTDIYPSLGGGHFYVDLNSAYSVLPITLNGGQGVAGAGSLTMNGIDVSAYAPVVLYFQAGVFDPAAPSGVALTNGLEMHLEK